jgi:thiamine-monophosphate kinase
VNERQIIQYLSERAGGADSRILQSIGDDCAVIDQGGGRVLLLTMDTLIEGVHFDCALHPPRLLGRKVVSVNISDIGAMGSRPHALLLSLGLPPSFDEQWFRCFADGLTDACRDYGCRLIGGDTVASPQGINCSVTVLGEMEMDRVVYRSGAQPGDTIWVSGPLGFAAAGLELLRLGVGQDEDWAAPLIRRHLDPMARVELGGQLAESGLVHAMIDLSDGLATDLAHLCHQSKTGALIRGHDLPGLSRLIEAGRYVPGDPFQWAVAGGEDFELLFTAAATVSEEILAVGQRCNLEPVAIGTITTGSAVRLVQPLADGAVREVDITYQGYDHFRDKSGS